MGSILFSVSANDVGHLDRKGVGMIGEECMVCSFPDCYMGTRLRWRVVANISKPNVQIRNLSPQTFINSEFPLGLEHT